VPLAVYCASVAYSTVTVVAGVAFTLTTVLVVVVRVAYGPQSGSVVGVVTVSEVAAAAAVCGATKEGKRPTSMANASNTPSHLVIALSLLICPSQPYLCCSVVANILSVIPAKLVLVKTGSGNPGVLNRLAPGECQVADLTCWAHGRPCPISLDSRFQPP
jgi:hypothetical protein